MNFVDIHQHIIYGMDDGPSTFQQTQEMLKNAWQNWVFQIVATPHVTPGVTELNINLFLERIAEAQHFCKASKIGIEILPGAEIFYTDQTVDFLDQGRILTLGKTQFVLVEFSTKAGYEDILDACDTLLRSGYIPVLAHIERYPCFLLHPRKVYDLKRRLDVRLQINCSTILSRGLLTTYFCKTLLKDSLVDVVASDAHNTSIRPVCMRQAFEALKKQCGEEYSVCLTDGSMTIRGFEVMRPMNL